MEVPTPSTTVTIPTETPAPKPSSTTVSESVTIPVETPEPKPETPKPEPPVETTPAPAPAPSTTKTTSTPAPTTTSTGGSGNADQDAYLAAHNNVRRNHGAVDLTWSDELAAAAQTWANNCQWKHSQGAVGKFGENLAGGTNLGIAAAVKLWTDEVGECMLESALLSELITDNMPLYQLTTIPPTPSTPTSPRSSGRELLRSVAPSRLATVCSVEAPLSSTTYASTTPLAMSSVASRKSLSKSDPVRAFPDFLLFLQRERRGLNPFPSLKFYPSDSNRLPIPVIAAVPS